MIQCHEREDDSMKTSPKRVISAGHICLDITPVYKPGLEFSSAADAFVPGSLVNVDAADVHTGGSVSNTGLALRRLGADVRLLGKVGDDALGKLAISILEGYGVNGIITDPSCSTSYSIVLSPPGIDRIFLHNPGANDCFRASDVPDSALEDAELFHFGYPPIMKCMYENEGEELISLFKKVNGKGLLTSLDMAMVGAGSEAASADWRSILEKLLPYVDFFVPSFEEIAFMLGKTDYDINALDLEKDVRPIAGELRKMGASVVLIKCGTAGLYYSSENEEGAQPAFKADKVCSATGAGDTCIAAFLISVLNGKSIAESARLAAAEGACCVTAYDALSGLKPLDELERRISCGWETI